MALFRYLCVCMRNSFLISVSLLLVILFSGCRKSSFKIDFTLNPDVWGNYTLSYYASDGKRGQWINTTVPLQSGKFSVTGVSRTPVLAFISNSQRSEIAVLIEPGQKIKISGDGTNPMAWIADGNKTNESLSAWRAENLNTSPDSISPAIAKFVKNNPDSPASAILLLTIFPRYEFPDRFVALWNSLGTKARAEEMADISGVGDFGPGAPFEILGNGKMRFDASRRAVRSLALRRFGGAGDTLRFMGKEPALIYFYKRNVQRHSESVDTLKKLRSAFPDSIKARLVTVSMDADSMKWRNAVIFDSIPKVLDSWMPLGPADSRARLLGISSTPYFLVVAGGGKQIYRGSDVAKAASAFRKQLSK